MTEEEHDLMCQLYYAWCDARGEASDLMEFPRHTPDDERELERTVCDMLEIEMRSDFDFEDEIHN